MTSATYHFKSGIPAEGCSEIVKYALTQPAKNGVVGRDGGFREHEMRKSTIRWLKRCDPKLQMLFTTLEHMCLKANFNNFGLDTRGCMEAQFTEYHGCDEGHYDWHKDDNPYSKTPWDRRLSCVVQLSRAQDYEGGKLEVDGTTINHELFSEQGDVIFFRSDAKHKVSPVTSGIRFSLVTWFVGPRG